MNNNDIKNNKVLAARYVNAWDTIVNAINSVCVTTTLDDGIEMKLHEDLVDCLNSWECLEPLSIEEAVRYLEGIAHNKADMYYAAEEALKYAVQKCESIARYTTDGAKNIDITAVSNYARHEFVYFLSYDMTKIEWDFENSDVCLYNDQNKSFDKFDEATQNKIKQAVAFRNERDNALSKVTEIVEEDMSYIDQNSAEYARYECLKAQFEQLYKELPDEAHRLVNLGKLFMDVVIIP